MRNTTRINSLRRALTWPLLALALVMLFALGRRLVTSGGLPLYDYVEYWSAGRVALVGGNPYDPAELLPLQAGQGWPYTRPDMMWNPPWALPLVMPFSLLDYASARLLWLLLGIAVVVGGAAWLWRYYGGEPRRAWLAALVAVSFVPALSVLKYGQISPLILLGVLGFLYFERRQRWLLAGACTILIALKPQLLYLFWVALVLWAVDRRRPAVFLGAGGAACLLTGAALAWVPDVIGAYQHAAVVDPPFMWLTPTLGNVLRLAFGWDRHWLQFAPPVLGAAWLIAYWLRRRQTWRWSQEMPLLLLASLVTTAYGWSYDYVVALAPLVQVGVAILASRHPGLTRTALTVYAALMGVLFAMSGAHMAEHSYVWLAPTFLALYLLARRPPTVTCMPALGEQAT